MKKSFFLMAALALSACVETGAVTSLAPDYLQLTPDEQNIWVTLDSAQRERAILFITKGGTLISSLSPQ